MGLKGRIELIYPDNQNDNKKRIVISKPEENKAKNNTVQNEIGLVKGKKCFVLL
jgi:hypothetical protein